MQDGALIRRVLQHITLHDGRWLIEQLNAAWYGKNPAHASPTERRAGKAAIKKLNQRCSDCKTKAELTSRQCKASMTETYEFHTPTTAWLVCLFFVLSKTRREGLQSIESDLDAMQREESFF